MLIQCEKCQTRYNLDEAKIPGKGAKVTCPSCKHVFIVMKDGGGPPPGAPPKAPSLPPQMPPQAAPQPKSLLDSFFDEGKAQAGGPAPRPSAPAGGGNAAARGIRSWKVRVASGLIY